MKRKKQNTIFIMLMLLVLGGFVVALGCSNILKNIQTNTFRAGENKQVIHSGKNYKIFDVSKNEDNPEYVYEIYDNSGKCVKQVLHLRIEPEIKYVNRELLQIQEGGGTNVIETHYYHVKKNQFSDGYEEPIAVSKDKVAYMMLVKDKIKLVVRDIFDKNKYYQEFALDFALSPFPGDVLDEAEFLSAKELKVSYFAGDDYEERTKVLSLN